MRRNRASSGGHTGGMTASGPEGWSSPPGGAQQEVPWPQAPQPTPPVGGWGPPPPVWAAPAPTEGEALPFGLPATVRWGMGDVAYGLLLWLLGGVIAAGALFATGTVDLQTGEIGELSLGMLALSVSTGWLGFVGWPVVATWWKGQRSLTRDFGLCIRPFDFVWGIGAGVLALGLSVGANLLWMAAGGGTPPDNADFIPKSLSGIFPVATLFVLVAVGAPIAEELFFRGLFLRSVAKRWGVLAGAIVSSMVFGLFHAQGDGLLHAGFIVAVTMAYGFVFALVDVRNEGRIGPSIVAHMVVNGVGVAAALLAR